MHRKHRSPNFFVSKLCHNMVNLPIKSIALGEQKQEPKQTAGSNGKSRNSKVHLPNGANNVF